MASSISTDEKHRETLAVLQEALDYLRRMPPVPVTVEMCRKLQRHLEQPTSRLVSQQNDAWAGGAYLPAGLCFLTARLQGSVLEVRLPPQAKGVSQSFVEQMAMERLRDGVKIQLENRGFDPFADAVAPA